MTMINRLLNAQDWDSVGLKLKDANPMLIERKICSVRRDGDHIVVVVADGPHPYSKEDTAAAEHWVPIVDIVGITYYVHIKPSPITAPNGNKNGKMILVP